MVGVDLAEPLAKVVVNQLLAGGIVANATSDFTIRFVPPLIVTEADCNRVVAALNGALTN